MPLTLYFFFLTKKSLVYIKTYLVYLLTLKSISLTHYVLVPFFDYTFIFWHVLIEVDSYAENIKSGLKSLIGSGCEIQIQII